VDEHPRIKRIDPVWADEPCIVAASGPSLTTEVAQKVRFARWLNGWRVIAVNDAYKAIPRADVLYACDNIWWAQHKKCEGFYGEKWSSHEVDKFSKEVHGNDKLKVAEEYGVNLVRGQDGDEFSFDPEFIRYGSNSGFQGINLALLFGCTRIVLVGFDMRYVGGQAHFFGNHPPGLPQIRDQDYQRFAIRFERAKKKLPAHINIVNATPGSALTCFPMMPLDEALRRDDSVRCDRAEPHAATG
jgi:hypothetical protein